MTESESHPRQTLGPFLAALALIVVLVVIIAVLNAIGVFGRNDPTPEQLVRTAVVGPVSYTHLTLPTTPYV